ncbi:chemokine-like receptor 1 [Rana temporaria]|uniref:chemokine-like receptor 1 n=1 Tax=Rana temporaria TaxID=8407 RepID=UPI001AAD7917|nr:chemokine-like receptor 1 [Rana temporaria]
MENTTTFRLSILRNSTQPPSSYDSKEKQILYIFSIIIFSLTFLLGTSGNGLVIWITTLKMKKTVNVMWHLNLATSDFIFTLFLPFTIANTALNHHWPLGRYMCKLNTMLINLNLYASVLQLTVISIDRCISIVYPVWCRNHRTPRLASFVVLAIWILALVFSSPFFIFRDTHSFNTKKTYCIYKFDGDNLRSEVASSREMGLLVTRFIITFFIPFTIIVSCCIIIMFRIQRNNMAKTSKPFKIIVAVIISFFVCWFPYQVFALLAMSVKRTKDNCLKHVIAVGYPLARSLMYINSCINPILYVFVGQNFKEKFWRSIHSVFENAFVEEYTKSYCGVENVIVASSNV